MNISIMKLKKIDKILYWFGLLILIMGIGAAAGISVLINGLSLTNLSDLVPWGLWITIDISAIALSAGAFSICALVYLVKLEEFKPLARTAAFVGLIGYTMAMCCLLLDIGRPDRFWHGFVFWNVHSVLWEVTMCVGLYFSVLIMENLSTFANSVWLTSRYPKITKWMKKTHDYAPSLAVAGLFFSLLHQSSLGATYGVIISRPAWYRPGIAILFIFSAVIGGIALTLLATVAAKYIRSKTVIDQALITKTSKILGWMVLGYLYLRFWDVFAQTYTYQPGKSEALSLLFNGPLSVNFWVFEIIFGALIPVVILLKKELLNNFAYRNLALVFIVQGIIAYRWDINLLGQLIVQSPFPLEQSIQYTTYTPSTIEILAGLGVVSMGLFIYTIGVKYLKVVEHRG